MDRFIVDEISEERAFIRSKEEILHIIKTLRMRVGDKLEITDGKGRAFIGMLENIEKHEIQICLLEEIEKSRELNIEIIVYQGIPKAQKMDWIIQKLTEIGVMKIVPVKFERCVRILDDKEEKQIARWEKIAEEAVKQSKRNFVPEISPSIEVKDFVQEIRNNDLTILFYENESAVTLKQIVQEIETDQKNRVGIIIGPEGGITSDEKERIVSFGAKSALIGNTILRTETAAIVGAGILAYELG